MAATVVKRHRSVASQRGTQLLEFAMVLPLLLILIAGIADFAFMFQAYEVVTNAAIEGARLRTLPGYSDDDAENRVRQYIDAANLPGTVNAAVSAVNVDPGVGAAFAAMQMTVTYTHTFNFIGPMMALFGREFGPTVNLTASSAMRPQVIPAE
jgi:Flp pilus assembly protein TadG